MTRSPISGPRALKPGLVSLLACNASSKALHVVPEAVDMRQNFLGSITAAAGGQTNGFRSAEDIHGKLAQQGCRKKIRPDAQLI